MKYGEWINKNMHIMSTKFTKTLLWKHDHDGKLWRHKQRAPNTNVHHMPLNEPPPIKDFCVRHWQCCKWCCRPNRVPFDALFLWERFSLYNTALSPSESVAFNAVFLWESILFVHLEALRGGERRVVRIVGMVGVHLTRPQSPISRMWISV